MMNEKNNSAYPNTRIPARDLSALLKVSGALASTLELSQVLQTAIESVVEVLDLPTGAIYLLDGERLYLGATTPPLPPDFPDTFRYAPLDQHAHIQKSLRDGAPLFIPDIWHVTQTAAEAEISAARGLVSILYIPLMLKDQPTGVVIVGSSGRVWDFTQVDLDLSRTLSYQISMAVANAQLYQSVQAANQGLIAAYDATLEGWSRALELKDHDTQGHTLRVANLAVELARRMGIQGAALEHLRRGALLHDIGKMGVPDTVLTKPGPLTDDEWAVMRKHPEFAKLFLQNIGFLEPALEIPCCHHEKWDGTGYPLGLQGEAIPFAARIFTVVDVYDALTSERSYRPAWSVTETLAYLQAQSGVHFDPQIVAFFLAQADLQQGISGDWAV